MRKRSLPTRGGSSEGLGVVSEGLTALGAGRVLHRRAYAAPLASAFDAVLPAPNAEAQSVLAARSVLHRRAYAAPLAFASGLSSCNTPRRSSDDVAHAMTVSDASFTGLMEKLRSGDQEVASLVFHRFAQRLIGLARVKLPPLVRAKVDPEDVLQSVYKSFFRRHAQGEFQLETWDSLWYLLTVITLRKCGHRLEYFLADKRNVQRESAPQAGPSAQTWPAWEAVAQEPTPSAALRLTETLEQLMHKLAERDRDILTLSLQGYSVPEIATQIGRTERTVQRALKQIRTFLDDMRAGES